MNCTDVQAIISSYFDGELASDVHEAVGTHIKACPSCAEEIANFEKLSSLVQDTGTFQPSSENWTAITSQLDQQQSTRHSRLRFRRVPKTAVLFVALIASLLLVGWLGRFAVLSRWDNDTHEHSATSFADFLDRFEESPDEAYRYMMNQYAGGAVSIEKAEKQLGYRPIVAHELPVEYQLTKLQLLKMPCCTCPHALLTRKSGGKIAVFEYEEDQPASFGERSCICANCNGIETTIVQFGNHLTATWKHQNRYVTIIGAKDLDEVVRLVHHFRVVTG